MRSSDTIGALAEAMAAFQATIINPPRNREVTVKSDKGSYKFEYATFDAILNLVRPALAKHGLCIIQGVDLDGQQSVVTTRLAHQSGEWLESTTKVLPGKGDGPQAFGSSVSYAKRYALSAMLGIASEEDDDGNAAEGNHAEKRDRAPRAVAAQPVTEAPPRTLSPAEAAVKWVQDSVAKFAKLKTVADLDDWEARNLTAIDKLADNHRDTWAILKRKMTEARTRLSTPALEAAE